MLKNYLKIAYRYFTGHKLFSFINIFGLAIGIATCAIISLWVQRELSYDRFHKNAHRICRIERELFRDNAYSRWPITGGAYKQAFIHLHPSPNWEIGAGGSMTSVYLFTSIAILILIIACINFMNLSTACANKRTKEVGLRKTIGAYQSQLKAQFIQESMLMAVVALFFAIAFISLFIPAYNNIFDDNLSLNSLGQVKNLIILIGTTLTVGFLAGLYPAFYLTKFEPAGILKSRPMLGSGKSVFRRNMVVVQFLLLRKELKKLAFERYWAPLSVKSFCYCQKNSLSGLLLPISLPGPWRGSS